MLMRLSGQSESPIGLDSLVHPSVPIRFLKISGICIFPVLQLREGLLIVI